MFERNNVNKEHGAFHTAAFSNRATKAVNHYMHTRLIDFALKSHVTGKFVLKISQIRHASIPGISKIPNESAC